MLIFIVIICLYRFYSTYEELKLFYFQIYFYRSICFYSTYEELKLYQRFQEVRRF